MVMRRIKPRPRVDTLVSETRKPRRSLGRIIYLGFLVVLLLGFLDLAIGHLFYLDADGQVMQRNYDVATEYRGTVTELLVEEGSTVKKGDLLARIRSREALERMADLRTRKLELERDLNDLQARRSLLLATRDAARERAAIMQQTLKNVQDARKQGLVNTQRLSQAVDNAFQGMKEAQQVISDADTIDSSIQLMQQSLDELNQTLKQIETAYGAGGIVAATGGLIANLDVVEGAVAEPGDSLMQIYYDQPFVLAQVPTGTAFHLEVGRPVQITAGVTTLPGRISHIYPVASKVSNEFQRSFEPTDRRQLVRIDFTGKTGALPLFTKVRVSTGALGDPLAALERLLFPDRMALAVSN